MLGEAWARSVGRWEEAEASGGSGKQPWRFVAWASGPLTYPLHLTAYSCADLEGALAIESGRGEKISTPEPAAGEFCR